MRKIRIFEHRSLDGVIEHDDGYAYGAWTAPYRTPEGMALVLEAYGAGFDLLLGSTYLRPMVRVLAKSRKQPDARQVEYRDQACRHSSARKPRLGTCQGFGSGHRERYLIVYPVLLVRGKRLSAHTVDARELAFVSTKPTPTGVPLNTYRYVGQLKR